MTCRAPRRRSRTHDRPITTAASSASRNAGCATLARVDRTLRIGDTVGRPRGERTDVVHKVLSHLEAREVPWAPRARGIDRLDREVVSWIPGETAASGDEIDLAALAGIVRQLHDLTTAWVDGFECVVHDDLQPRNVVVRGRRPVGLIDWEQARPGRRVEDVAKLCWSFVEPTEDADPVEIGERWRHLAAVYGLEQMDALLPTVLVQQRACADDIERESAAGSERHQLLAMRGDHVRLRSMHAWTVANERLLRETLRA